MAEGFERAGRSVARELPRLVRSLVALVRKNWGAVIALAVVSSEHILWERTA